MTIEIATDRKASVIGSAWMIAAMAIFAIEDAFVKAAFEALPVGQILIIFGLGGAGVFTCLARVRKEPLFLRDVLSTTMRIRAIFEITGRLFYVLAISMIPLSAATVILQATPLVVVAGAALVFDEKVGWRRWAAILLGLVGVLVIVQPGTDSFSVLSIFAIIGMIGFAGRDLASRAAPVSLGTLTLGFYGFLSIVVAGLLFSVWEAAPFVRLNIESSLYLLGAVLAGVAAYSCLMNAMRTGAVSAVTPFRYTRLLFGIALGVLLFGEQLSIAMLMGASLIIISGLFINWRSRELSASM